MQKAVCDAQRFSYIEHTHEDEAQQETHIWRRAEGIYDDQKKVQPSEKLTKWRILDVDWNDNRPIHRVRSNEHTPLNEADDSQPKTSEEASIIDLITIDLMDEVVDEKCIWEDLAFIARIIGPKQSRKRITPWVEKNWGRHAVVKYLPKGFFVIIFAEREERDQALNAKNWYFEYFPLYIQPWTPNFDPLKLAVYDTPIWIRLFNLSIEYWGDPCLEKIG
ncbi:hypothetical protein SUGI_0760800 [Cryptomeria japonica]|nr:hypothetical protein SUGI_0760800 [Cryptomeria japonica]